MLRSLRYSDSSITSKQVIGLHYLFFNLILMLFYVSDCRIHVPRHILLDHLTRRGTSLLVQFHHLLDVLRVGGLVEDVRCAGIFRQALRARGHRSHGGVASVADVVQFLFYLVLGEEAVGALQLVVYPVVDVVVAEELELIF